jgi:glycosyl transferase family 25
MNELAEQFLRNQDEEVAVNLLRYARCNNLFHIGCLLGKFLEDIFPHSVEIKSEYGVILYYSKKYESSYEKFNSILDMRGLTKEQSTLAIFNQHFCICSIKDMYISTLDDYTVKKLVDRKKRKLPLVTLTITSCKRFDLFVKTINSFVRCCGDIYLIDEWFCVDDNSSEEDRKEMQRLYPFIKFYFKNRDEKGHPQSMNIIRKHVKTPYTFHMEDDWQFFECRNYISECLEVLGCDSKIGQCLINKNYSEIAQHHNILGGEFKTTSSGLRYYLHQYCVTDKEKEDFAKQHGYGNSSSYWPHFSFRPSLLRTKIYEELGEFNQTISHFEMDYSYKYASKGYISAFLEKTYCLHIGRLTSERNNKNIPNAYELNGEAQLSGKEEHLKKKQEQESVERVINETKPLILKTFVVNLDRRPDRMSKFTEQKEPDFLKYNRFSAVDGSKLVPTSQLQQIFENNDYNMRSGMVGCAMSHIKLYIQLLQEENVDAYCIFEDDIDFVPNFQDKFIHCINELQKTNWDLFYLGHHLYTRFIDDKVYNKETIPVVEQFNREKSLLMSMGGTGGYVITKNGAERLLNFINEHGMTNGIDTVQQKSADILNVFYSYPHLIYSECYRTDAVNKVDTDIQFNYTSLTIPFDKRLEEEFKCYDVINLLEQIDESQLTTLSMPSYYISDNKEHIRKLVSESKHPCYTIEDRALFIIPSGDNGRFFHRFKKNGKWNIDDAIKYMDT